VALAEQPLEFVEGEKDSQIINLQNADGTPYDLTGFDPPKLYVRDNDSVIDGSAGNLIDGVALVIVAPATNGQVRWDFDFTANTTSIAGHWRVYAQKSDLSKKRWFQRQPFFLGRNVYV
jgi:hypothetical protein